MLELDGQGRQVAQVDQRDRGLRLQLADGRHGER